MLRERSNIISRFAWYIFIITSVGSQPPCLTLLSHIGWNPPSLSVIWYLNAPLLVLLTSITLKRGKDDYACLGELLICVCPKHCSEVWRKTNMLVWQNCLSVFVASIALKWRKTIILAWQNWFPYQLVICDTMNQPPYCTISIDHLCHHVTIAIWISNRQCIHVEFKYKMRCSWLDGISPST